MGVAYFIVLDNAEPGFDVFVNGKSIAKDAERLSKMAKSLGIKAPEEMFSMSGADAESASSEFGLDGDVEFPPEQWFAADEGIEWVARLRKAIETTPKSLKHSEAVLRDLAEFEAVFTKAKTIGARWHFSIDF